MSAPPDDEERTLKMELMRVDIQLKAKQAAWETPRNIAILVATVATVSAAAAGWVGYGIGQRPATPIIVQLQYPPAPAAP